MSMNLVGVITGAAIAAFTAPTYTLAADTPPGINGKQSYVTAIGGTQTGVNIHTVSAPFTSAFFKPVTLKVLAVANATTGIATFVPTNVYKRITRTGAIPLLNNPPKIAMIKTEYHIPAGTDTYSSAQIKAMISLDHGLAYAQASGIADSVTTGTI